MTLSQSKDTLVGMETVIGYDGRGVVNQTGGTYGYLDMILGYNSTGSGTYNLSGGDLVSIQWAPTRIGYSGTGIFNHTGGINDTYNLVIGGKGGTGTYNLGGTGELIGYVSRIGYLSGTGTFNQSGGSHKTCWLEMGPDSTYNLSGTGFLESCSIDSDGTFNYSGGSLHFYDIFGFGNGGNFNLSGRGSRIVGGNLDNGGVIRTTNTSTIFDGTLGNGGAFISDSSVNIFTDLIIGEDGYMQGDWEDLWYVCDKFQGVKIEGNVVTNIFGSEGMYIFYLPGENAYLGGLTYNLTGGGKLVPTSKCPELVEIDVKPGTYPNDINPNSKGVVPVAILTTADFDANSVDPGTVVFAGAKKRRWTRADVNNDGRLDLLFHFNTQDLDLTEESTAAILSGTTYDGMDIIGRDAVSVVPAKKKLISIQFSESKGRVIKALPFLLSGSKWRSQRECLGKGRERLRGTPTNGQGSLHSGSLIPD